eukprot:3766493-Pyramimonas_sp.AAC.1
MPLWELPGLMARCLHVRCCQTQGGRRARSDSRRHSRPPAQQHSRGLQAPSPHLELKAHHL